MPAAAPVVGIVRDGVCQIARGETHVRAQGTVLVVAGSEAECAVKWELRRSAGAG